jgi:hypothetical protein
VTEPTPEVDALRRAVLAAYRLAETWQMEHEPGDRDRGIILEAVLNAEMTRDTTKAPPTRR